MFKVWTFHFLLHSVKKKKTRGREEQARVVKVLDCFVVTVFESFHHISSCQKVRIGACAKKKRKVFS